MKLKKEYIGKNVISYLPDGQVIHLETATEKEIEAVLKQKGNEEFFIIEKKVKDK